ncbi:MAG: hypothetical protein ACLFVP_08635 [Candidatus Bathyarchaeia archaeon]
MNEEEDLPVTLNPVKPLVSPEKAAEDWELFEDLKAKLLTEDDYQPIAGKHYIKRSGFRKIAVYFGLSDRILEQERVDRDDDSFFWRIVVEVEAPNGRVSTGVGACDSRERNFAHVEHDVYAIAHTRAKSRAISDMVAGGAVSAEEMEAEISTSEPERPMHRVSSMSELEELLYGHLPELEDVLVITEFEDGFKVNRAKYLETPLWQRINERIQELGGKWVSSGRESHWVIPKA